MARKFDINEIFPVFNTHNTFAEGGRKIHLHNYDTGRCLCGYDAGLFSEVDLSQFNDDLIEYIAQPDPDGNICLRCKSILINNILS